MSWRNLAIDLVLVSDLSVGEEFSAARVRHALKRERIRVPKQPKDQRDGKSLASFRRRYR